MTFTHLMMNHHNNSVEQVENQLNNTDMNEQDTNNDGLDKENNNNNNKTSSEKHPPLSKKPPTSKRPRSRYDIPNGKSKRARRTKNITNTPDHQNNNNSNDHHDQDNNHNALNEGSDDSSSNFRNTEDRTNDVDRNEKNDHSTNMRNQTITITFGEQAENHRGMQKIGELGDMGFTIEELKNAQISFEDQGFQCEYVSLTDVNPKAKEDGDAAILIVRRGVNALLSGLPEAKNSNDLFEEQSRLDTDKRAFMRGRVVKKVARHNLCFDDQAQEPEYEQGKGRIIAFDQVPLTGHIRDRLPHYLGSKATKLKAEGNYYYDLTKCYIGFHGDSERKRVIALRLGASMPLYYQWYYRGKPVGTQITLTLNNADMYIMSEKATGWDWKRSSIHTLRHAAGSEAVIRKNTKKKKPSSKTTPSLSRKKSSSRRHNNDIDTRSNKRSRTLHNESHEKKDINSSTEKENDEENNHPISNDPPAAESDISNINQHHNNRSNDHTEQNSNSENHNTGNTVADSNGKDDNIIPDDSTESTQQMILVGYGKLTFSIPTEHLSNECCMELLQSIKAPLIPEQLSDTSQSMIHCIIRVVEYIDNHQKARFPFFHAWLILIMLYQVSLLPSESSEDKKRAAEELENVNKHIKRFNSKTTRVRACLTAISHLLQDTNRDLLMAYRKEPWFCWTIIHDLPLSFLEQPDLFISLMKESQLKFELSNKKKMITANQMERMMKKIEEEIDSETEDGDDLSEQEEQADETDEADEEDEEDNPVVKEISVSGHSRKLRARPLRSADNTNKAAASYTSSRKRRHRSVKPRQICEIIATGIRRNANGAPKLMYQVKVRNQEEWVGHAVVEQSPLWFPFMEKRIMVLEDPPICESVDVSKPVTHESISNLLHRAKDCCSRHAEEVMNLGALEMILNDILAGKFHNNADIASEFEKHLSKSQNKGNESQPQLTAMASTLSLSKDHNPAAMIATGSSYAPLPNKVVTILGSSAYTLYRIGTVGGGRCSIASYLTALGESVPTVTKKEADAERKSLVKLYQQQKPQIEAKFASHGPLPGVATSTWTYDGFLSELKDMEHPLDDVVWAVISCLKRINVFLILCEANDGKIVSANVTLAGGDEFFVGVDNTIVVYHLVWASGKELGKQAEKIRNEESKEMEKEERWKRRGDTSKEQRDKELRRRVDERLAKQGHEYSSSSHYECIMEDAADGTFRRRWDSDTPFIQYLRAWKPSARSNTGRSHRQLTYPQKV